MSDPEEKPPFCEQIGREKFEVVIENFYRRLLADDVLGHYFRAIPDSAAHRRRFTEFWWIGLGGESADPPVVDMVGSHARLGLEANAWNRWAGLFAETVHEFLEPDQAEAWIRMAQGIIRRLRTIQ